MLFHFRVDYSLTRLMDNNFSRESRIVEAQSKTQAENRLHEHFINLGLDYYADVHRIVVIEEEKWEMWIMVNAIEAVRNDRTT